MRGFFFFFFSVRIYNRRIAIIYNTDVDQIDEPCVVLKGDDSYYLRFCVTKDKTNTHYNIVN